MASANQNEDASSDAPSDENPHSEDSHLESDEEEDFWDQNQVLQEPFFQEGIELTEEAIREALHPVLYERENSVVETDECPICLMPYSEGEEVAPLQCGHYLHFECTRVLLRYGWNACAICRAQIIAL